MIYFRPNNLTVDTTSIAFPLITMGAKSATDLANEIRSSLHFNSFSWNLFWLDLAISSSTSDWIWLSSFLSTHSAIVVSSTYFHSSVLLVLMSSIMRINSHGPSLVPLGTPVGSFLHSDEQSSPNLTLCVRSVRKSMIQKDTSTGMSSASSFLTRSVWSIKLKAFR